MRLIIGASSIAVAYMHERCIVTVSINIATKWVSEGRNWTQQSSYSIVERSAQEAGMVAIGDIEPIVVKDVNDVVRFIAVFVFRPAGKLVASRGCIRAAKGAEQCFISFPVWAYYVRSVKGKMNLCVKEACCGD
jgi:hypothetical protein